MFTCAGVSAENVAYHRNDQLSSASRFLSPHPARTRAADKMDQLQQQLSDIMDSAEREGHSEAEVHIMVE